MDKKGKKEFDLSSAVIGNSKCSTFLISRPTVFYGDDEEEEDPMGNRLRNGMYKCRWMKTISGQ